MLPAPSRWGELMQNDRRQFYIFDLEVGAKKAGAVIPTMDDLLPIYQAMHTAKRTYAIRRGTGTMLIGDIVVDAPRRFATFLIRLSDKSAPNSVYSDPAANAFNEHVKVGNVGSDFGCHVIISTAPERGQPNVYTCAIERISGLPFALVQRLLSKFLNFQFNEVAASFSYPHPAGGVDAQNNTRMERCCPHIELRGRPSDTLIADLNNGRISGVTLVKAEPVTPIAGAPYLVKSRTELKLDVNYSNMPANVWTSLRGAMNLQSADYGTAKVSYRIPGSKRAVTVEFDSVTGSPVSEVYIKHFELMNIFPFLAQSARLVVRHLNDLAVPLFIANRTI